MSINSITSNPVILDELATAIAPSVQSSNQKLLLVRNFQLQDTSGFPLASIQPIAGTVVNGCTVGQHLYYCATVSFYSNVSNQPVKIFLNALPDNAIYYISDVSGVINTITLNIPDNLNPLVITSPTETLALTIETTDGAQSLYTTTNCFSSFQVYQSTL